MPRGVGVRVSSSSLSIAEIAQLVEHNLAKVGVASSSLVFRSMLAQVAELVDAHVSGACVERRAGSTPVLGTTLLCNLKWRGGGMVDALL